MFAFDPRDLWLGLPVKDRGGSSWLDVWTDATNWWVNPTVAGGAREVAAANERALAELLDGIVGRFEGQRVTLVLDGRPLRAVLDWIRVRRIDERYEARLELTEVEVNDWSLTSLSVAAASIRIEVIPTPRLTVSGIEITGRMALCRFILRLDQHVSQWHLAIDDGRITASRAPGRPVIVIHPVVRDGRLEAEVRAARWRGMQLTLPMWLRIVRRLSLPALPYQLHVEHADLRRGDIEFQAHSPTITEELDLVRLRDAIASRSGSIGG